MNFTQVFSKFDFDCILQRIQKGETIMKKLTILLISLFLFIVGCSLGQKSPWDKIVESAGLVEKSTSVDAFKIFYHEGGKGETILLVHGFGLSKESWTVFAKSLTPKYHVVIIDLPGHGKSSKLMDQSYTIDIQADRINKFADKLKLKKFHIVGNSMGGTIAGEYAVKYPERLLSLALFDTGGVPSAERSEYISLIYQGKNVLIANTLEEYNKTLEFLFFKVPPMSKSVKEADFKRTIADAKIKRKIFPDMLSGSTPPLETKLQDIKAPTLILWGDKDRITDVSSTKILEEGISNSKTIIMKDCGHMPMTERPEETAEHYLAFIKDI